MYFWKCPFSDGKDEKWYYRSGKHEISPKNKEKYFLLRNALVDHICITEITLWNNTIFCLKFNINYVIFI